MRLTGGALIVSQSLAVTPNDAQDIPNGPWLCIWATTGGDINGILVDAPQGDTPKVYTIPSGFPVTPLAFRRIYSASTTASGISVGR